MDVFQQHNKLKEKTMITKNDTVDKITFTQPDDIAIANGIKSITIKVMRNIQVDKSGLKSFEADGRRHNQTDLEQITESSNFRNRRVIVVKSGTDIQPYILMARQAIESHIERRKKHFEQAFKGADELTERFDSLFEILDREHI